MTRHLYVHKNVKNVPPEIRRAVVADARERAVTISDVVGELLARAWDLRYEASGETSEPGLTGTQFVLRLPQEIVLRIYLASRVSGLTESSVILSALADHYGLEFLPKHLGGAERTRKVSCD